jgi:hypothetical protein
MKHGFSTVADDRASSALPRALMLIAIALVSARPCIAQAQSGKHAVTVKFDYDFTVNHACSPTVTKKCVAQFNVYDISAGQPTKLFSIPVPPGASGPVKSIAGESQPLLFETGKHRFAVTAQMASGEESDPRACKVWAQVP